MQESTSGERPSALNADSLSLLSKLLDSAGSTPSQSQGTQGAGDPASDAQTRTDNTSGGDILTSLLSNPELLSKLPQMISLIKPLLGATAAGTATADTDTAQVSTAGTNTSPTPVLTPHDGKQRMTDNRSALLHAMKPYLSSERREAIDYIVKLERLGEILKSL